MHRNYLAGTALILLGLHCSQSNEGTGDSTNAGAGGSSTSVASTGGGGSGGSPSLPTLCDERGLDTLAFNDQGPFGSRRHDLAEDFTVALQDGSTWNLSLIHI